MHHDNCSVHQCVTRLLLLHSTASTAPVQSTSKTSAPQWSTPPVGRNSIQPITVTCSSHEPGQYADEASVLLAAPTVSNTPSSSPALAIYQLRTIQSWVENPSLQHQPLRTMWWSFCVVLLLVSLNTHSDDYFTPNNHDILHYFIY